MGVFKIYDYESAKEYATELSTLTCNWNMIKLCYEVWKEDIIKCRKADLRLNEIAGVGTNYINEICAGRVEKTNKIFNAQMDGELLQYLRGKASLPEAETDNFRKYVALKIANNKLIAQKKAAATIKNGKKNVIKKAEEEIDNDIKQLDGWLRKQCKGKLPERYIMELQEKIVKLIPQFQFYVVGEEGKRTVYGKLKAYLEGRNSTEVILNENNEKIAFLFKAIYDMPFSVIEKLEDRSLEELFEHIKMFYNKIEAEVRLREVKKIEQEFYKNVQKSQIMAESTKEKNKLKN